MNARPRAGSPVPFLVLSLGRSGSNLLATGLAQHPAVSMAGELFVDGEAERREVGRTAAGAWYRDGRDAGAFLREEVYGARYPDHVAAVGFRLFYYHARRTPLQRRLWAELQRRDDVRLIRLVRRNLFAVRLSVLEGEIRGQWVMGADSAEETREIPPLHVSPEQCELFFRLVRGDGIWTGHLFRRHQTLEVDYDSDLCGRYRETMHRLQDFLDVPRRHAVPVLKKIRRGTLRQRVANLDELREYFRGSQWEAWFADDDA